MFREARFMTHRSRAAVTLNAIFPTIKSGGGWETKERQIKM